MMSPLWCDDPAAETWTDVADVCNLRPTGTCANGCDIQDHCHRPMKAVSMATAADLPAACWAAPGQMDKNTVIPSESSLSAGQGVCSPAGGGALRQLTGGASLLAICDVTSWSSGLLGDCFTSTNDFPLDSERQKTVMTKCLSLKGTFHWFYIQRTAGLSQPGRLHDRLEVWKTWVFTRHGGFPERRCRVPGRNYESSRRHGQKNKNKFVLLN